jgi:hypothetical protein
MSTPVPGRLCAQCRTWRARPPGRQWFRVVGAGVGRADPANAMAVGPRRRRKRWAANPSSCSVGIDLPVPAVQSCAGTVLPLRKAVPILGIGATPPANAAVSPIHRWGGWRCTEPWPQAPRQRASPAWAETASAGSVARPSSAARWHATRARRARGPPKIREGLQGQCDTAPWRTTPRLATVKECQLRAIVLQSDISKR